MNQDPYWCPKEGCDYGSGTEQKSKAAVRSHINASADHDWPALKPLVEKQGDQSENNETASGGGDETSDEESDDQQASSDTERQEGDSEQEESNNMVSAEEYEQAHSEKSTVDTTEDTRQTNDPVGQMLPTLDTSTIVLGLAVLGAVVAPWSMLGDSSEDYQQEAAAGVREPSDDRGWSPQDIEEVAA